MAIIDLSQERDRRRPPGAPPPDDLRDAANLVRAYVRRLMDWSEVEFGAADIACGDLCCFADCIERVADNLEPSD